MYKAARPAAARGPAEARIGVHQDTKKDNVSDLVNVLRSSAAEALHFSDGLLQLLELSLTLPSLSPPAITVGLPVR